jgi:hypothetical protein
MIVADFPVSLIRTVLKARKQRGRLSALCFTYIDGGHGKEIRKFLGLVGK